MAKIVLVSEIDSKDLFEYRQYMLGDQKGKWVVVGECGTLFGIYKSYIMAKAYLNDLNIIEKEVRKV